MRLSSSETTRNCEANPSLSPGEATAQSFVQLPMKRDDSVCGLPCRQFARTLCPNAVFLLLISG